MRRDTQGASEWVMVHSSILRVAVELSDEGRAQAGDGGLLLGVGVDGEVLVLPCIKVCRIIAFMVVCWKAAA